MFNPAMENIRLSPIVAISEEVNKRALETGKDFILFQRGEIGFPTPQYIVDAMKDALDKGMTKYPVSGGHIKLKNAIVQKLKTFNNVNDIDQDNIVVTHGGQEGLQLVFKLFEGKKVVGFAPTWSCVLENFVPYAKTNFVEIPLADDFSIDYDILEKEIKDAAFLYLNTPHNPTGKIFIKEEIENIVAICKRYNVFILSDEAYEHITFDGNKHFSPMQLDYENIISVYTFSKTYAMTGWRLGYLVSRDKHLTNLIKLGDYTQTAGIPTYTQFAGAEALTNTAKEKEAIKEFMERFCERRIALYEGLKSIAGVKLPIKPEGAFYIFPDFSEFVPKNLSEEESKLYIFNKLLEARVATVYGSCFGHYFKHNLRFSYSTTDLKQIEEGIERIKKALSK
ncbi:MAG TPA: aminotransferase class I/II-fold pyridoxal phosphate-dependent enzyme [Ignavibacteriaceae bacterium]|nr:aminotransferase class I/II-fold pyridoxal phosphate-dependent enzyme [Ignavibacteriaceae bacterium]